MEKYKFQCKAFCMKCEKPLEFYSCTERKERKVYTKICTPCQEQLHVVAKVLGKKQYWTSVKEVEDCNQ